MVALNSARRWYTDSAGALHPLHGDVGEGEHQHRPRLLGAGRGHPGQDVGARGGRGPAAHRRGAPAVARAARPRLLHLGPQRCPRALLEGPGEGGAAGLVAV